MVRAEELLLHTTSRLVRVTPCMRFCRSIWVRLRPLRAGSRGCREARARYEQSGGGWTGKSEVLSLY